MTEYSLADKANRFAEGDEVRVTYTSQQTGNPITRTGTLSRRSHDENWLSLRIEVKSGMKELHLIADYAENAAWSITYGFRGLTNRTVTDEGTSYDGEWEAERRQYLGTLTDIEVKE